VSIVINTTFVPHQELLRYSNVSGTNITGFTYPEGEPPQGLGSWGRGSFYLFFYWEKSDTHVSFEYFVWLDVAHADNWVTVTEPGYFALAGIGYFLLSIGILVGVITLYMHIRTKLSS
jgi:hypothetical protein